MRARLVLPLSEMCGTSSLASRLRLSWTSVGISSLFDDVDDDCGFDCGPDELAGISVAEAIKNVRKRMEVMAAAGIFLGGI